MKPARATKLLAAFLVFLAMPDLALAQDVSNAPTVSHPSSQTVSTSDTMLIVARLLQGGGSPEHERSGAAVETRRGPHSRIENRVRGNWRERLDPGRP